MKALHPLRDLSGFENYLSFTFKRITELQLKPGGLWNHNTKIIVSGTFPPYKEIRPGYFYFSSSRNQFYKHVDAIFNTTLFLRSQQAKVQKNRVDNASQKAEFFLTKNIGFIDIFQEVERSNPYSASDSNITDFRSIFDNGLFADILSSQVNQIVCVYSLALNTFKEMIAQHYHVHPRLIVPYCTKGNLPLEVYEYTIDRRKLYLVYAPIHGPIEWKLKQGALSRALTVDGWK